MSQDDVLFGYRLQLFELPRPVLVAGIQIFFTSFMRSILGLRGPR